MTLSLVQKINASIEVNQRIALGVTTAIIEPTKTGTRERVIQWGLTTDRQKDGKITGFSLHFQQWKGKEKGNFAQVAKLIPSRFSGFTVTVFEMSTFKLLFGDVAIAKFVDLSESFARQMVVPIEFYVLSQMYLACNPTFSGDSSEFVTSGKVTESVVTEIRAKLPTVFPEFYGLIPTSVDRATLPQSDSATVETETKTESHDYDSLSKEELIELCEAEKIKIKKSWGEKRIISAILEAQTIVKNPEVLTSIESV